MYLKSFLALVPTLPSMHLILTNKVVMTDSWWYNH